MAFLPILGKVLGGITGLSSIFGGGAKGAGDARMDANQLAVMQDRNRLDAYQAQQTAIMQALLGESNQNSRHADIDLERQKFTRDSPMIRGKQALAGSLMQNLKPVQLSGLPSQIASRMPTFSGGLSADALGPIAKQMGLLMQENALAGQQKGDSFAPLPVTDFRSGLMPTPQLAELKSAGLLEKILGGVGLGGSLLGAIMPKTNTTTPPYSPPTYGGARGR